MKKHLEKLSILSLSLMLVSTFSPSSALPQMIAFLRRRVSQLVVLSSYFPSRPLRFLPCFL